MKKDNLTATTVKIEKSLYDDFKVLGVRHKLTLQTFVEKCVRLYVGEESFRMTVDNYIILRLSHSGSFGA